ncbi:ExeM/NucH family extracellular endonuclease [Actinomycetaceae bacterium L2_0104]
MNTKKKGRSVAVAAAIGLLATPLITLPAGATPSGDDVVINEVGVGAKFVELYNPTDAEIDLSGMYISYYSTAGAPQCNTSGALSGSIEPGGYYLIHMAKEPVAGLPDADAVWGCGNAIGRNGGYSLSEGAPKVFPVLGDIDHAGNNVVDYVGLGNHANFETATAASSSEASKSVNRTNGADTDNNSADFTVADISPENSGSEGGGTDPTDPPTDPTTPPTEPGAITPIAEIQGSGASSPLAGQTVTTQGFVTAKYPVGGKNGIYIQTEGTGGTTSHAAPSVALFVYDGSAALPKGVEIGDFVEITGAVSEFNGSTQITVSGTSGWKKVDAGERVAPQAVVLDRLPVDEAGKEALEGMLVDFSGPLTVTDNYQNGVNYGEIGAAFGDQPLRQPSDLFNPTRDGAAALQAVDADNAARLITIDDGRTQNWNTASVKNSVPLPYISNTEPVRTGAAVDLVQPAVVEFSFEKWRLQPVEPATDENGNRGSEFFAFENDRPAEPADVGGDVSLSGFNVLNYFTTTAADINCTSTYKDRQGNPITANSCDTVRGAANAENLARQQEKIVSAINTLDSTVVSLEEIENSAKNGKNRDAALETLTKALNAADSSKNWAYVPSPSTGLPSLSNQDVIRTAFIYQADQVKPVGESKILNDQTNFSNAREPLAQEFVAIDANGAEYGDSFVAIVNHFKSKGSGTPAPDPWQGNANADRVNQANALGKWANEQYPDTAIFVIGDLNAYSAEDPILKLGEHGYTRVMDYMAEQTGDESYLDLTTYQYSSLHGSLDQALGNDLALDMVNDAEVYAINAPEAIALEYSRYNNYLTIYHDATQYRSSDHDPVKIGLNVTDAPAPVEVTPEAPSVEGNVVTIPVVEGVVYTVDGEPVEGTIELSADMASVTVVAEPADGFVFSDGAVTEWTFMFDDGDARPVEGDSGNVFFAETWKSSLTNFVTTIAGGDELLVGDFDGDGVDTLVVRTGDSYTFLNTNRPGSASTGVTLGAADGLTVVGDFDGDGLDDLAVRQAGSNRFDIYYNTDGVISSESGKQVLYGRASDTPVAGNWDGKGGDTLGIRRGNVFHLRNSLSGGGADVAFAYGRDTDQVLAGDFDRDGKDSIAVVRDTKVHVRNSLTAGPAQVWLNFGRAGDVRVVGDWFGTGTDTPAAYRP